MRKIKTDIYSLKEYKEKIISDLQEFLIYKRTTTVDFGHRLMKPFKVIDFSRDPAMESLLVNFEGYATLPQAEHYWVDKKEFENFVSGNKKPGATLFIDKEYHEDGKLIFEINLIKNQFKKPTVYDAEKLNGLTISHNGNLYKSYDVQVKLKDGIQIEKLVRVFVFESTSAETFILKNTVARNKIEINGNIKFESNETEEFVTKADALKAIKLERESLAQELKSWFALSMFDRVDEKTAALFLKKLNEI